jgi:hypothetical protein
MHVESKTCAGTGGIRPEDYQLKNVSKVSSFFMALHYFTTCSYISVLKSLKRKRVWLMWL